MNAYTLKTALKKRLSVRSMGYNSLYLPIMILVIWAIPDIIVGASETPMDNTMTMAAPIANNDNYNTPYNTPFEVGAPGVLGNDTDPDGDPLNAELVSDVTNGTLTFYGDGSFSYEPDSEYHGVDSFTYFAADGVSPSNTATVTIIIGPPPNNPPVAVNDNYSTPYGITLDVASPGILGNDTDADGDPLTIGSYDYPDHGDITIIIDGAITYEPNPGFHGTDSFTYIADDGQNGSNVATVTITVEAPNSPPVANPDYYITPYNTELVITAPGVMANDSDPDSDPIHVTGCMTSPTNGTVSLWNDGAFEYMPDADFQGTDGFTYRVSDGINWSNTVLVTILVNPPVNAPPIAADDSYTTPVNTPLNIDAPGVLFNDMDIDSYPLEAVMLTWTSNEAYFSFHSNGSFEYTPQDGFTGSDSFTYYASDGIAASNTATVTITVTTEANHPPVAVDDIYFTIQNAVLNIAAPGVLANDTDADGDPLHVASTVHPVSGTLELNVDGSFTYTPDSDFIGTDSFKYKASDGTANSDTATVHIIVNPPDNHPPVAVDDSYSTPCNTPLVVAEPGVQINDSDADNEPFLSYVRSATTHGTIVLDIEGAFTYTPNPDFSGVDSFTYYNFDGIVQSTDATVTITVEPPANSPPIAHPDSFSTPCNTLLSVIDPGILANDTDADGDPLTIDYVSGVSSGILTIDNIGSFTYDPDPGFQGVVSFSYRASDGHATSNAALVTITVTEVTDIHEGKSLYPRDMVLYPVYPNPFNSTASIRYDLPEPAEVLLVIYNDQGQQVRLLLDEYQGSGRKSVTWNGRDDRDRSVSSGIYLCRLQAGKKIQLQKLILAK